MPGCSHSIVQVRLPGGYWGCQQKGGPGRRGGVGRREGHDDSSRVSIEHRDPSQIDNTLADLAGTGGWEDGTRFQQDFEDDEVRAWAEALEL